MIIISPYSKQLRSGKMNPKNYPYWKELISLLLKSETIIQVGTIDEKQLVPDFRKNLKLKDLHELVKKCTFWISIDNFFHHMAHYIGKKGVVIWGPSDPDIFGYPENLNILKDRNCLRKNQFDIWEACQYDPNLFLNPEIIFSKIKHLLTKKES